MRPNPDMHFLLILWTEAFTGLNVKVLFALCLNQGITQTANALKFEVGIWCRRRIKTHQ